MRRGEATTTITFRCEGCGTRVVSDGPPVEYSGLATGCSLACTLLVVTQYRDAYTAALKTRTFDPDWLEVIAQAGMRPTTWLTLMEREYRLEAARLSELMHRERLAREAPALAALLERHRPHAPWEGDTP